MAGATTKLCWTWVAALHSELPAWLASRTQVPAPMKLTVPPEMEQTELALASTVMAAARPEVAWAVGV
jgi:hypothetical protein